MNYRKLNNYTGWLVFLIATIVYFITIEDTVSLWDCGEYITAAYKLEVGHPPGAPLFMVLGRLFSFFAAPENVAVWINRLSALSSSLTILFMFWSITALVRKMVLKTKSELSTGDIFAILGSGIVGGLAYTFSDTFWFSAVEGEVYAMASLFTAIIFWAILKWDEEMAMVQNGTLSTEVAPNRWLLLIMFLIGLAIGVHLLGILLVPAIGYVIYFRLWNTVKPGQFVLTGVLSVFILGFIQEGIIPGSISMASSFEVAFRNSFGLPFFSGTIFFFVLLVVLLIVGMRYARKKGRTIVYNSLMGLILLLIGYGSFAVIVIRSNANTPLDENDPENLVTLHSYLKRDQYGSAPLLSGPYWNSMESGGRFEEGNWNASADRSDWDSRAPFYLRRFIVKKGENVVKAFKSEESAKAYVKENGGEYEESYYESNASSRENAIPTYSQTTFFPRMYYSDEPRKVEGYKTWSGYDPTAQGEKGKDKLPLPTFGENMQYFFRYQCNWMYMRYFMWNFAGRQNDYQNTMGDAMRGNWKSGFAFIDDARLGNQEEAPYFTTSNPSNNSYYFIPLILGLIGLVFHAYKSPKDAFVVFLGFLFTGLAIVVYLNQKVFEPRERDYAYAGSFYFFAIWIGVSVYALYYAFQHFTKKHFVKSLIVIGPVLFIMLLLDMGSAVSMPNTLSWLLISGIGLGLIALMVGMRKVLKKEAQGAILATVIGLAAPIIMGVQGWDDHDRSLKTSAHDLAFNYLSSCADNSIIFTNGDNDTFPLWYMQEVEGFRTDVRVCNLSLMQTDWYTEQMMMKAYTSEPLPIQFTEDQIMMYSGVTDQVYFQSLTDMFMIPGVKEEAILEVIAMRVKANPAEALATATAFSSTIAPVVEGVTASSPNAQKRVDMLKGILTSVPTKENVAKDIHAKFKALIELFIAMQNQVIKADQGLVKGLQDGLTNLDAGWQEIELADAMKFVRNDKFLVNTEFGVIRMFPSNTFKLTVNKQQAIQSGVVPKNTKKSELKDKISFKFNARAITREEVMMLDIIANNDWKRGIYFSSPYGSEVSKALLSGGGIKQNGINFELNPLNAEAPVDVEEMFINLTKNYHYGEMANPDVLTDYYARRHTTQYRMHFATLCRYYLNRMMMAERIKTIGPDYVNSMRQQGNISEAENAQYMIDNYDKVVAEAKDRVSKLLDRSLEVMPASLVLDNGEPSQNGAKLQYGGATYPRYTDGALVDYVQMYFDVDNVKQAEKLGLEMASQYQSVIDFFLKSNPAIALEFNNQEDLFAALDSYIQLYVASNSPDGNPTGKLAATTSNFIYDLYEKRLPEFYKKIEEMIADKGENTRRGSSGRLVANYYGLKDYLEALGAEQGIIEGNAPAAPQQDPNSGIDFNQLLEEQMKSDSVNQ